MTTELKPCRFCDNSDQMLISLEVTPDVLRGNEMTTKVCCVKCGARGPVAIDSTKAIEAWNDKGDFSINLNRK